MKELDKTFTACSCIVCALVRNGEKYDKQSGGKIP